MKVEHIDKGMLDTWVRLTDGFTFSHLREFVIGCYVFGEAPQVVAQRLRSMGDIVDSGAIFNRE